MCRRPRRRADACGHGNGDRSGRAGRPRFGGLGCDITTDGTEDPAGTIASATVAVSGSFVGSGDTLSVLDNGGTTNVTSGPLAEFPAISVSISTDANGNETLR